MFLIFINYNDNISWNKFHEDETSTQDQVYSRRISATPSQKSKKNRHQTETKKPHKEPTHTRETFLSRGKLRPRGEGESSGGVAKDRAMPAGAGATETPNDSDQRFLAKISVRGYIPKKKPPNSANGDRSTDCRAGATLSASALKSEREEDAGRVERDGR